ncbi:MAG: hypothetical protein RRB13_12045 [bacterium]|nr:hypothetical protein [bacterium]
MMRTLWFLPLLLLALAGCLDNGGGAYVTANIQLEDAPGQAAVAPAGARAAALKTSLIMVVPSTVTASEALHYSRPTQVFDQALEEVGSGSVTLRLPVGESLKLIKFTFAESLSIDQIFANQPIPYGTATSAAFEITAKTSDLTVTLFAEDLVLNQPLYSTAAGRYKLTLTGKQAFDAGRGFSGQFTQNSGETSMGDYLLWVYGAESPTEAVQFLENSNRTLSLYANMLFPNPANAALFELFVPFADATLPATTTSSWIEPKHATAWTMAFYDASGNPVTPNCYQVDPTLYGTGCPEASEHFYEEMAISWTAGIPTVTRTFKSANRSKYQLVETYAAHPGADIPSIWAWSSFKPSHKYYKSNVTLYQNTAANTATTTTWTALGSRTTSVTWTPSSTGLTTVTTNSCLNASGTEATWSAALNTNGTSYVAAQFTGFSTAQVGYTFNSAGDWAASISCSFSGSTSRQVTTNDYSQSATTEEVTLDSSDVYYLASGSLSSATKATFVYADWGALRPKSLTYKSYSDLFTTYDLNGSFFDYTYNNLGLITGITNYQATSTAVLGKTSSYAYEYDAQGRYTSFAASTWSNDVEAPLYKVVFGRDASGRISSERSYAYSGTTLSTTATCASGYNRALDYTYSFPDTGGMTVTVQSYCSNSVLSTAAQNQWTVAYDSNGLITQIVNYQLVNATLTKSLQVDYSYDSNLNLTLKKTTTYNTARESLLEPQALDTPMMPKTSAPGSGALATVAPTWRPRPSTPPAIRLSTIQPVRF